MPQKRMFSLKVTGTDRFMEMPTSTQALYFHLGMNGDDDGFVASPKIIARAAGCNDDDMRLLAAKGFIIPFESGVIVITEWRINNTLKNDRYQPTIYQEEKQLLHIEASGKYRLEDNTIPDRIQNGSRMEPQRNLTQRNLTQRNSDTADADAESLFALFWNAYPRKVGKKAARKIWAKLKPSKQLTDQMLSAISIQKQSDQWRKNKGQYIPNPTTWLNQGRWEDDITGGMNNNGSCESEAALHFGTEV